MRETREIMFTADINDEFMRHLLGHICLRATILPLHGGESVQDVMHREEKVREGTAAIAILFPCQNPLPERHFRVMRPGDFKFGGFMIPDYVPPLDAVPFDRLIRVAVSPHKMHDGKVTDPYFQVAVDNFYCDLRGISRRSARKVMKSECGNVSTRRPNDYVSGFVQKDGVALEQSTTV